MRLTSVTPRLHSQLSYCINLVRHHDYEHYLCTLLLPKVVQPAVFALRSFNIEVALIKDRVSEIEIGRTKICFWRDTVNTIYKETTVHDHPVAITLSQAVRSHRLSKRWLVQLLDARETDMERNTFYQTSDLEHYAERTSSSLLYLTLEALDVRDVKADHVASHIGKAEGIATLLRASAYYRSKKQVLIPMDILTRHGASQEDVLRGNRDNPSLLNSVYDVASLAHAHLKKAQALANEVPPRAIRAFLPAIPCRSFLNVLEAAQFDIFNERLTIRNSSLPLTLLWRTLRKKYY